MSFKYAPVHKEKHKNIKVKQGVLSKHLVKQSLIPMTISEFEYACAHFPIVFAQKQGSDSYEPVIVTGVAAGENLWVENEQWIAEYTPQICYRFPFGMVPNPEQENSIILVIDENSEQFNETEGNALFNEDGSETDYLINVTQSLVEQHQDGLHTQLLTTMLKEFDVLTPLQLDLTLNGAPLNLTGLYQIDREKMYNLATDKMAQFHEKGYLLAIYAHMTSIHQFVKLMRKKEAL